MQNATANIASLILPLFCNFQFLVCISKLVVWKHKNIITLIERNILFGWHDNTAESKDILNYVTLVAKYYVFCTIQDSDDVPFDGFPSLLKNKLNTSQQIAVKNETSDNFNKKWKDFIWVFLILLSSLSY